MQRIAWIGFAASLVIASCGSTGEHEPARASAASASQQPLAEGVKFSPSITNPYFPLSSVRVAELRSDDEHVVCEVQDHTRRVAGVDCTVLAEKEYEDDELAEISYNYFAQDPGGNVYYFGEQVDEYDEGKIVGHGGAWLVGENAVEPCLYMPARLAIGASFKRENSPPDAEEWNEIEALDAVVKVPAGEYHDVLVVKEADHQGKWKERKYYARGVGLISENLELDLVSVR